MKLFFSTLLTLLSFSSLAWGEWLPQNEYIVSKDEVSSAVPAGKCKVKGHVTSNLGNIENGIISNMHGTHSTVTDTAGYYEFFIPAVDTSIFFYKSGLEGIMVWSYPFKSGHEVTIDFFVVSDVEIVFKPVIYAYSEEDLKARISINPLGEFTFTYPAYNEGWNIEIKENQLYSEGVSYPYLFWEAEMTGLTIKQENPEEVDGFIVTSGDLPILLDSVLTEVGLNPQERSDLITFWVPKVTHKSYVFIQFLENEEYATKVAGMEVQPTPDNINRLYLLCSEVDDADLGVRINPQHLVPFERNGFTIVEWGGSIIDIENILL